MGNQFAYYSDFVVLKFPEQQFDRFRFKYIFRTIAYFVYSSATPIKN